MQLIVFLPNLHLAEKERERKRRDGGREGRQRQSERENDREREKERGREGTLVSLPIIIFFNMYLLIWLFGFLVASCRIFYSGTWAQ